MLGERGEVILLREWGAVVLRTVQIHGQVYVKQLPKLLSETKVSLVEINPSRELERLEACGYLRSRYQLKSQGSTVMRRVYRITRSGERALKDYQEHLQALTKFLKQDS